MKTRKEEINVCCPLLDIIPCGDTKEHNHPACGGIGGLIANSKVVDVCLNEERFKTCPNRKE